MKKFLSAVVFGLAVAAVALPASAAGPFGISFSGMGVPFIAGDAGDGAGAPKYDDAFDTGYGARFEFFSDFSPTSRGQLGFLYEGWSGQDFGGIAFDDLKLWAFFIGGKSRFMPGSPIRPYIVADIGVAYLEAVNISTLSLVPPGTPGTLRYWDSTVTYFADLGLGVEFMITPNLGIYADVRGQIFGEPDAALTPTAEADPGIKLPVSVGINFSF